MGHVFDDQKCALGELTRVHLLYILYDEVNGGVCVEMSLASQGLSEKSQDICFADYVSKYFHPHKRTFLVWSASKLFESRR